MSVQIMMVMDILTLLINAQQNLQLQVVMGVLHILQLILMVME